MMDKPRITSTQTCTLSELMTYVIMVTLTYTKNHQAGMNLNGSTGQRETQSFQGQSANPLCLGLEWTFSHLDQFRLLLKKMGEGVSKYLV